MFSAVIRFMYYGSAVYSVFCSIIKSQLLFSVTGTQSNIAAHMSTHLVTFVQATAANTDLISISLPTVSPVSPAGDAPQRRLLSGVTKVSSSLAAGNGQNIAFSLLNGASFLQTYLFIGVVRKQLFLVEQLLFVFLGCRVLAILS